MWLGLAGGGCFRPHARAVRDCGFGVSGASSSHVAGCQCQRCRGFELGNLVGLRHGAYATLSLRGRAGEVAEAITALMVREDLYRDSFAPTV